MNPDHKTVLLPNKSIYKNAHCLRFPLRNLSIRLRIGNKSPYGEMDAQVWIKFGSHVTETPDLKQDVATVQLPKIFSHPAMHPMIFMSSTIMTTMTSLFIRPINRLTNITNFTNEAPEGIISNCKNSVNFPSASCFRFILLIPVRI